MSSVLGTNALAEVAGAITDFFEKLAGSDGTLWLLAFKRFLRKENPWPIAGFPVWKTIKLGTCKTADDFLSALKRVGMKIGDYANDILGKPAFTASETETEVDLVNVSVADLGFKNGATRRDIYSRAQELGLGLCPAEVGPQLRLQYEDQPKDEWLLIAMEPIADSGGYLHLFRVAHDSYSLWLSGSCGDPESFWDVSYRFVFVGRK